MALFTSQDDLVFTLSGTITSTQTTGIRFSVKRESTGDAITPDSTIKLITIDHKNENYEHIYFPNGFTENATGDITLNETGLVRGLGLSGTALTAVSGNAKAHGVNAEAGITVNHFFHNIIAGIISGTDATGANALRIGDETDSDITLFAQNADANKPFLRYDKTENKWVVSNDGVAENPIPETAGGEANASETVKGIVELATLSEQGSQTETGGTGANLVLQAKNTLSTRSTYTPAYLTGGTNAQGNYVLWTVVTDGSFRITIDGTAHNIDGITFVGNTSMDDVAATIQTAIRTTTGGSETVVWSTDHFVITSGDATSSSAIAVLETSTGTVGTDISGAGASDWLDCDSGNGTITEKALNQAADAGKVPVFNASGELDEKFLPPNVQEANTFFGSTDISGAEAETLTDGSNADSLHAHSLGLLRTILQTKRALNAESGSESIPHGLGYTPSYVNVVAMCKTSQASFTLQSIGCSNGVINKNSYIAENTINSPFTENDPSFCVHIEFYNNPTQTQKATIALDDTNVTINWTGTIPAGAATENIFLTLSVFK